MRELLNSLSLGTGALVMAVCSAALAWPLSFLRPVIWSWLSSMAGSLAMAYVLYWSPVWLGSKDTDQHGAWQFFVVGIWFIAGAAASSIVILVLGRRGKG